jgi:AcrR family transcriptional regulator
VESAKPVTGNRLGSAVRSAPQNRILTAAHDLFAEHGVSGTSLQMIADTIGVTKAAVYHQFKTKDEIVLAVTEMELASVETALEAAEAQEGEGRLRAREALLTWVINLAVERRRLVSVLQFDPVIIRLLAEHEPFQPLIERLYGVLIGDDAGRVSRVQAAMLSAAIGGTVMHPLVADLDDDTLRTELLRLTRRILDLPDEPHPITATGELGPTT